MFKLHDYTIIKWCLFSTLLISSVYRVAGLSALYFFIIFHVVFQTAKYLMKGKYAVKLSHIDGWLLIFFASALLSWLINYQSSFDQQEAFIESLGMSGHLLFERLTIFGVIGFIVIFLGYRMTAYSIHTNAQFISLVRYLIFLGALNAIVTSGFWLFETGGSIGRYNFLPPLEGSNGIHVRLMAITFLLALASYGSGHYRKTYRRYLVIVMLLTGFSALTVVVRQEWIMFLVSIFIYLTLSNRRKGSASVVLMKRTNPKKLILGLLILSAVILSLNQEIIAPIFAELLAVTDSDTDTSSLGMRVILFTHALSIFLENLWFGVGFGHYGAFSTLPVIVSGELVHVMSPHNGLAGVAAEGGLIGLTAWLGINLSLIREIARRDSTFANSEVADICNAISAVLIVNILAQFVSNGYIIPMPAELSMVQMSFLLWVLVGLLSASRKTLANY